MTRIAPIVLATEVVTYLVGDPANTVKGSTSNLRNPEALGVLISQIGFVLPSGTAAPAASVRLRYKGEPITNGWIPIPAFTWVRNETIEQGEKSFVVKLDVPLYLGPGEWIDVSFSNALCGGLAFTAQAFAVGEFGDPPATRMLPYFTAFVDDVRSAVAGTPIAAVSTPQDLGNPFARALTLERIVGRVVTALSPVALIFLVTPPGTAWIPYNLRLSDDMSRYWIPTPTPLSSAINVLTRAWITRYTIPPKGFLRVELEGTSLWTPNIDGSNNLARLLLGLISYRQIG